MKTITLDQIRTWEPCINVDNLVIEKEHFTVLDVLSHDGITFEEKLWVVCREQLIPRKAMLRFANYCYAQARECFTSHGKKTDPDLKHGDRNLKETFTDAERVVRLQENFMDFLDPRKWIKYPTIYDHVKRDAAHQFLLMTRVALFVDPPRLAARTTAKFASKSCAWAMSVKKEGWIAAQKQIELIQKDRFTQIILEELTHAQAAIRGKLEREIR